MAAAPSYAIVAKRKGPAPADWFLLLAAILLSAYWTFGIGSGVVKGTERIEVRQGRKVLYSAALDPGRPRTFRVQGDGFTMAVRVAADGVRVLPMDKKECPNGICSRMGPITKPMQSIICAPNLTTVTIVGRGGPEVDAMTG